MDIPHGFPSIPEEKIAPITSIDTINFKETHEELLRNFNIFEICKKNTHNIEQKLLEIITSQNKDLPDVPQYATCNTYSLDLDRGLQDLEYFYKIEDIHNILFLTTYIINYYKNILTISDYITLIFKQSITYRKNNMLRISNKTLKQLASYEKYFTSDNKILYYLMIGSNLSCQGLACDKKDQDIIKQYFFEAYQAFNTLLMQESLFENNFYKKLMFKMAICDYKAHNFKECLRILTEIQHIPEDSKDTALTSHILFLRGLVYEEFNQYQKTIDTFQKYLLYIPHDEIIKERIKILSKEISK